MSVTTKSSSSSRKSNSKAESGSTKSWSFKEGILAFRRSLVSSLSHENGNEHPVYYSSSPHTESHIRHRAFAHRDVWHALSPMELPECACIRLAPVENLSREVFAAVTGPNTGFLAIPKWHKERSFDQTVLDSWKPMQNRKAHGLAVSLYEKNPFTNRISGEPIADAFVVRARCDSAFLAVADGVNWGRDAMQAARCAIFAVYEYLERHLYNPNNGSVRITNTREAAQLLFETFSSAQDLIVKYTTGLTTLCVALILPVADNPQPHLSTESSDSQSPKTCQKSSSSHQFALIVVSVGDSQAFLLSKFHGIREVTGWIPRASNTLDNCKLPNDKRLDSELHTSPPVRDFRDCGGALGSVYADGSPELNNLICAVTLCDLGDFVILGSDGLTDNFDPVITQVAVPESPQLDYVDDEEEEPIDERSSGSLEDQQDRTAVPAKSWFQPLGLSPPSRLSVWPRPPPPPPTVTYLSSMPDLSHPTALSVSPDIPENHALDSIRARHLNFTNQLELTWAERRRYAGKEMERIWHETDAILSDPASACGGVASSRDLCDALVAHALKVTARKRELLQDPEFARLRMTRAKLEQLNLSAPEDELGVGPAKAQRRWLTEMLRRTPGKLDHAAVAVYEVGRYHGDENELYEETALIQCNINSSPSTTTHSEP